MVMTCCRKLSCLLPVVTAEIRPFVVFAFGLGLAVASEHAGDLRRPKGGLVKINPSGGRGRRPGESERWIGVCTPAPSP